ncbi:hypothetical protein SRHO_G00103330 [Serrasalmus rhombeus]
MKLLAVVLMLLTLGAVGKVVENFKDCTDFFWMSQPPLFYSGSKNELQQILPSDKHKTICQAFNNKYYFATLYDTVRKIPVYSAYEYTGSSECNTKRYSWRSESELKDEQASNKDYENSKYDRGHLYPVCHAPSPEAVQSTYTLTNAAPQKCDFNKMWYHRVENKVRETLKKCPQNTAYIVTGVVPSDTEKMGAVTVPSHYWTAYYGGNNCAFGGYIMGKDEDDETKYERLNEFEDELSKLYKRKVQVFSKKQPRTS